ncbi:hypothetical protein GQR36_02060 [Enterococcus termitis]
MKNVKELRRKSLQCEIKKRCQKIICPNCQSTDVSFMGNDRKSFSVGKAAAGTILTGGVGALAGFTGKKEKINGFARIATKYSKQKNKKD